MDWIIEGVIIGSFFLAFAIGSQDETMATSFGSGSLKLKNALVIASIVSLIGILIMAEKVGKTIGKGIFSESITYDEYMLLAIVLSTAFWLIVGAKWQKPISTTHSVVSAVFGAGLIWGLQNHVSLGDIYNWRTIGEIFLGWILSPLIGFFSVILIRSIIIRIIKTRSTNLIEVENTERIFRYTIIAFAILNQFSRAGNDAGNAFGLYYGLESSGTISATWREAFLFLIAISFVIGLDTYGKYVIENVGMTTGQLRPSEAVAIESTVAIDLFICTYLGIPVSGGHILIFTMLGNAWMKGERPDMKEFVSMIKWWIATIPMAAILSALLYYTFLLFV